MRTTLVAGIAALLVPALAAAVVVPPPEIDEPIVAPVSTTHEGEFAGRRLRYTATFAERVLRDASGKVLATISATAYTLDGARQDSRPLLFAFNGGPGASSSPLHFNAFGPFRQVRGPDGSRTLAPNPQSLLPLADLVFIDPVSTGFSRVLPGGSGAPFWSPEGDARAVLDFIRAWIAEHGRAKSPLYIAGESYGGFRIATLAKSAQDLPIDGLVLISPGLALGGGDPANDLPYVFELPTLAVAAVHHGKADARGRSIAQVFDEAAAFAQDEYVVALMQGAALQIAERDRLAAKMAPMLGLPAEAIAQTGLRIDSETFLNTLLKAEGKLVGRLDTRITGPIPTDAPKDRPAAANDPALGLGATNVIKSAAIGDYLRKELQVNAQRDYVSLTLDVNFLWDWRGSSRGPGGVSNPTPNLAALMRAQPDLRLLVVGGVYDLATPVLGVRYAIRHAGIPLERVTWAQLESGHSPFEGDAGLARMDEIFRDFLRSPAAGRAASPAAVPAPASAPAPAKRSRGR